MIDLHLFVGRRLSDGSQDPAEGDADGAPVKEGYAMNEMKVDDVHYGTFPQVRGQTLFFSSMTAPSSFG